jgi:hypothetical protein
MHFDAQVYQENKGRLAGRSFSSQHEGHPVAAWFATYRGRGLIEPWLGTQ